MYHLVTSDVRIDLSEVSLPMWKLQCNLLLVLGKKKKTCINAFFSLTKYADQLLSLKTFHLRH